MVCDESCDKQNATKLGFYDTAEGKETHRRRCTHACASARSRTYARMRLRSVPYVRTHAPALDPPCSIQVMICLW